MPQYSGAEYPEAQHSKAEYSEARYWTIVAVDIAGFTDPRRSFGDQLTVHRGLNDLLERAFNEADIEWNSCDVEDRGDGKLILVPPNVPRIRLADQLWGRLLAGLRRHNATYSDAASIQLRVALHAGDVRSSSNGKVGPALNFTARILEAPVAKASLARTKSMLALIASETFFRDVITHDQAAEPDLFQQIPVEVKETRAVAWLRLSDQGEGPRVRPLLPEPDIAELEEVLTGLAVPSLPTVVHRAVGPGVRAALPDADAWDTFRYLAEFNAGADGIPPVMSFVELLARHIDNGSVSARLCAWNDSQARRLRLGGELARLRSNTTTITANGRLHLMIVIQHDGIEPGRFTVSYWRQDDPEEWPPARGESRTAWADEIERRIDELVIDAERAWQGHPGTVALEIVLPRALLSLPVHLWRKEHDSGDPRPLCLDYPIVVRSLERMVSDHWHRTWKRRWRTLQDDPEQAKVHFSRPPAPGSPHAVGALLERDQLSTAIVLSACPPPQPRRGDELMSALRSGLPAVLWHRLDDPDSLREIVDWLADEGGLGDLPARSHALRRDAHLDAQARFEFDITVVRDLVIMWDDPDRLVTPDELVG